MHVQLRGRRLLSVYCITAMHTPFHTASVNITGSIILKSPVVVIHLVIPLASCILPLDWKQEDEERHAYLQAVVNVSILCNHAEKKESETIGVYLKHRTKLTITRAGHARLRP